jgi:hypothetical protein
MTVPGLLLVAGGIVAVALAVVNVRGPLAYLRRLDETQANLDRYEVWRGRHTGVEADGPTGADEMRAVLRRRVIGWGAVGVAGAVAVVVGLLLR